MTDKRGSHGQLLTVLGKWALTALFATAASAAITAPVVPLQGVTLSSQGTFDRGCSYAGTIDCDRGCAFVGERLYCWATIFPGCSVSVGPARLRLPSGYADRIALRGTSIVPRASP